MKSSSLCCLPLLLAMACASALSSPPTPQRPVEAATSAPSQALTETLSTLLLKTLGGEALDVEELRGKVILLDIWATWCEPCRHSLPFYAELKQSFRERGFEVLAVSIDERDEAVRAFLQRSPLPFPVLRDPGANVPRTLEATAMPMAYLVDRRGVVRLRHEGFARADEAPLRAALLELLGEPEEPPAAPQ